jgi:molybdopterin-guanine dinucleotide biosynthesis protein A
MNCSTPTIRANEKRCPLTGSALILGGGLGTRIGYDKKKLVLSGAPVLESLAAQLGTVFDEVLLSSNTPAAIPGIRVLADTLGKGPMAGIYQGLLYCKSEYLYVVACDMPFVNVAYIAYMRALVEQEGMDVCIARQGDDHVELFNSFYKRSCAPVMEEALSQGAYQIRLVFPQLKVHIIDGDVMERFNPETMFFNINNKEDLEQARQRQFQI